MLILSLHGGLVSQIRAFYIGYKLSKQKQDELILDLSDFYNGYYQPYLLDCFIIPDDMLRIAFRGNQKQRILSMETYFEDEIEIVADGSELEKIYCNYDKRKKYYIANDCCYYDYFCANHREYFFRYIGKDALTDHFFELMEFRDQDEEMLDFFKKIDSRESVGVHIRLGDFVKIGWAKEQDFDFYTAAIQWLREHTEKPHFYIFSDDMSKAMDIVGTGKDIVYMQHKGDTVDDAKQLMCLARCKHKILTKKSGYGLFASTLEQNKWGLNGYSVIIETMTLDDTSANYEYVDQNFNSNIGCHQNSDLSNCISLSRQEIDFYKQRYCYCAPEKVVTKNTNTFRDCSVEKLNFLFLTYQSFRENCIVGMQKMAKVFSDLGNEVFFVGDSRKYLPEKDDDIDWTLENGRIAEDMNGNRMEFKLYPYAQLNQKDSYVKFIKYIQKEYGKECYLIIRKPKVLTECRSSIEGVRYIFIDFTDRYEVEDSGNLSCEELEYMYRNTDLVITYDYENYTKWKQIIGNRIHYIDISKYYPDICVFDTKSNKPLGVREVEDVLYSEIYNCILKWIKKQV